MKLEAFRDLEKKGTMMGTYIYDVKTGGRKFIPDDLSSEDAWALIGAGMAFHKEAGNNVNRVGYKESDFKNANGEWRTDRKWKLVFDPSQSYHGFSFKSDEEGADLQFFQMDKGGNVRPDSLNRMNDDGTDFPRGPAGVKVVGRWKPLRFGVVRFVRPTDRERVLCRARILIARRVLCLDLESTVSRG